MFLQWLVYSWLFSTSVVSVTLQLITVYQNLIFCCEHRHVMVTQVWKTFEYHTFAHFFPFPIPRHSLSTCFFLPHIFSQNSKTSPFWHAKDRFYIGNHVYNVFFNQPSYWGNVFSCHCSFRSAMLTSWNLAALWESAVQLFIKNNTLFCTLLISDFRFHCYM